MIQAIYREEKKLSDLSPAERYEHRQLTVKPLVEAYFAWVHKVEPSVLANNKTHKGLQYSINQEQYLKVFLEMVKFLWITTLLSSLSVYPRILHWKEKLGYD